MAEGTVAADQLRLFIERIERLEEEKKGIADDVRDVYAEAKANGYDPKIMQMIVRLRTTNPPPGVCAFHVQRFTAKQAWR